MEKWQFIYVNLVILGFIFQMILISGVYIISKSFPKEKTDKEMLEAIYEQSSLSGYYFKNLKF